MPFATRSGFLAKQYDVTAPRVLCPCDFLTKQCGVAWLHRVRCTVYRVGVPGCMRQTLSWSKSTTHTLANGPRPPPGQHPWWQVPFGGRVVALILLALPRIVYYLPLLFGGVDTFPQIRECDVEPAIAPANSSSGKTNAICYSITGNTDANCNSAKGNIQWRREHVLLSSKAQTTKCLQNKRWCTVSISRLNCTNVGFSFTHRPELPAAEQSTTAVSRLPP